MFVLNEYVPPLELLVLELVLNAAVVGLYLLQLHCLLHQLPLYPPQLLSLRLLCPLPSLAVVPQRALQFGNLLLQNRTLRLVLLQLNCTLLVLYSPHRGALLEGSQLLICLFELG